MAAGLAVASTVVSPDPVLAAGSPNLTVTKTGDAKILVGAPGSYTITVCNSAGPDAFNLSIRDVLPPGVTLTSGSPAPDMQVADAPTAGSRTLIWNDVSDLPTNACKSVSYTATPTPGAHPVGDTVVNTANAYVNTDARTLVKFDGQGNAVASSWSGSGTDATVVSSIIPYTLTKAGPGEFPRGVHKEAGSYTLTLTNNPTNPTGSFVVDDYLPPNLELLGCGGADHSAGAEYAGSGPLATGTCTYTGPLTLASVQVETVGNAGAPVLAALGNVSTVYPPGTTHVRWTFTGSLPASGVETITYPAGIPLFENRPFTTPPSVASGDQGANIDNNTGPETNETVSAGPVGAEPAVANATYSAGTYSGPFKTPASNPQYDAASHSAKAEDLALAKAVTGTVVQGTTVSNVLTMKVSEYRQIANLTLTDNLPDGQCPLGRTPAADVQCAYSASDVPKISVNGGPSTAAPFTSVAEVTSGANPANGSYTLTWNKATVPGLALLNPDDTVSITFLSRIRTTYRQNGADAAAVLNGDAMTNGASVVGTESKKTLAGATPGTQADGQTIADDATAGITGVLPDLAKRVAMRTGVLATGSNIAVTGAAAGPVCAGVPSANYLPDLTPPNDVFGTGDIECFKLHVGFPKDVDADGVVLADYLPTGFQFIRGSVRPTAANTVTLPAAGQPGSTTYDPVLNSPPVGAEALSADAAVMTWTIGAVANGAEVFDVTFAAYLSAPPDAQRSGDLTANLFKMSTKNSAGSVFPYRASSDVVWKEPQLEVVKGVKTILRPAGYPGGTAPYGADLGVNYGGIISMQAADEITYRVDLQNDGNTDASRAQVWDKLPTGLGCATVKAASISNGGVCLAAPFPHIEWNTSSNLTVGKNSVFGGAGSVTLTYTLVMPNSLVSNQTYTNTAGLRQWTSLTNSSSDYVLIPANNIDPSLEPTANTTYRNSETKDSADIMAIAPQPTKTVDKATASIGDTLTYTVVTDLPLTVLHKAGLTDTVPSNLTNVTWTATLIEGAGTASPVNRTAMLTASSGSGNTISIGLPDPMDNTTRTPPVRLTLTVTGRVANAALNAGAPQTTITNTAAFAWSLTNVGAADQSTAATASTTVVEPSLTLAKSDDTVTPTHGVDAGTIVTYTVTVTNNGNGPAFNMPITDSAPIGMVPTSGTCAPTPCTVTGQNLSWTLAGPLAAGAAATLTYKATVVTPRPKTALLNTATVTSYTSTAIANPDTRTYGAVVATDTVYPVVTLAGDVYVDKDSSSSKSAGDPAIGGVTLTLSGFDILGSPVTVTTTTDGTGHYLFTGVLPSGPAGYTVTETQPTLWGDAAETVGLTDAAGNPTVGTANPAGDANAIGTIVLSPGVNASGYNFGEIGAIISGTVWIDIDRDGTLTAESGRLAGIVVTLTGAALDGTVIARTATTRADGTYDFGTATDPFGPLPAGTYTITETQPPAYGSSTPNSLTGVVAGGGGLVTNQNFGETLASVAGFIYVDKSNDGSKDAGEPGIGGVTVTLTGADANGASVSMTAVTAADGSYSFTSLLAGTYAVTETQPSAWNDGLDTIGTSGGNGGNDVTNAINLTGGTQATGYLFGERGAVLSGVVFIDRNRDTTLSGEPGVGGVTLTLLDSLGVTVGTTVTAADGTYSFGSLPAGSYTVVETQPTGYGTSTSNSISVSLPLAGSINQNFGETVSTLSGHVYLDVNADAARTGLDTAIGGTTVTLTGTDANGVAVSKSTIAAADGTYAFIDLLSGTYTITETQPGAWGDGADQLGTGPTAPGTTGNDVFSAIGLGVAQDGIAYDFGELGATISGHVTIDADSDGVRATSDAPIGGVKITLSGTDVNGNPVLVTTNTASDGTYSFGNVAAGTYTITETQPTGYGSSTTNSLASVAVAGGSTTINQDFGDTTSTIGGNVYVDRSNDGIQQAAEQGIGGVTVMLTGTDALGRTVTRLAITAVDGTYGFGTATDPFGPLLAGTYTVTETQPTAWSDGTDKVGTSGGTLGNDVLSSVALGVGVHASGYDFGERGTTLSGQVFYDANRDGLKTGDSGLGGVTITLLNSTGTVAAIAVTAPDGTYSFTDLAAGSYSIVESQPNGYGSSTIDTLAITLPLAGLANQNFGDTLSTLAGNVYLDRDLSSTPNAGDTPIGTVTITLTGTDATGATVSRTTTTAADGTYSFNGLLSGSYTLAETQPAPWGDGLDALGTGTTSAGTLGNDNLSAIVLGVSQDGIGYNFGERGGSISGVVFVDDARDSTLDPTDLGRVGGVVITLSGTDINGNAVSLTTTTLADGTYIFAHLPAAGVGGYTLVETQPNGYGSSTPNAISGIVLTPGGLISNQQFAETTSTLAGQTYVDVNDNGARDAAEPAISGVTITLTGTDAAGNPVSRTTTTAADGTYSFGTATDPAGKLLGGTYAITETQPVGYQDGKDQVGSQGGTLGNDTITAIGVGGGLDASGYDFGEKTTSLSGVAFIDAARNGALDAADTGRLAGVTVTLTDSTGTVAGTTTTAADGSYAFVGLTAGTYTVAFTGPAGYGTSTPTTISASVPTAGLMQQNLGLTLSSLSGRVFEDVPNDGVSTPTKPGIGGVTVTLTGTDTTGAAVTRSTTTAPDGTYTFTNVLAGSYTVIETQPSSYTDGKDAAGTLGGTVTNDVVSAITLPVASDATGYVFAELPNPTVGGSVFLDRNRDGFVGSAEPGVGGVTITLTGVDTNGNLVVRTTTTAADGSYSFPNVAPGTYSVIETQPTGYGSSSINTISGVIVPSSGITQLNFGDTLGLLAGNVYVDADNSASKAASEAGIAGVTVTLAGTDATGATISRTTTTAADGSYAFADLLSGTYTVTETQPITWSDGLDAAGTAGGAVANDTVSSIALGAGGLARGYDFGERGATLSGTVFADHNGDGTQAAIDAGLGGVTIRLLNATGTLIATAVTGADGSYSFANLATGTYTVQEVQPTGYGSSTPNSLAVALPSAGLTGRNFGETFSTLAGLVFHDDSNDGIAQVGEAGLGGVVITLTGTDATGATVNRSTTTASDGTYLFKDLLAGTYTVHETQPSAFVDGIDAVGTAGGVLGSDDISAVGLGAGVNATGYTFGEKGIALTGTVYLDINRDAALNGGELGLGGVTITLSDAGGFVASTITAADGSYSFPGVPAGSYTITENQPGLYGTSTPNVLAVTVPAAGLFNQNFGETAGSIGGSVFHDTDANGAKTAIDLALGGITVRLLDGSGVTMATTITAADGSYRFTGLPAGTYSVAETQPTMWADGADLPGTISAVPVGTAAANDVISAIVLPAGSDAIGYDFAELGVAITGTVKLSGTNAPIGGVTITLLDSSGRVVATTTSRADGSYTFGDLPAGGYTVVEAQPNGYGSSTPNSVSVTLTSTGPVAVDFIETLAVLSGHSYIDANNDGTLAAAGEPGLAGVTIMLTGTDVLGAMVSLTTTTAADGTYSFTNLLAGTYTVTEAQPASYLDGKDKAGSVGGTPAIVSAADVIGFIGLPAGATATGYDFGELQAASISGAAYVDSNNNGALTVGELPLGSVVVTLDGFNDLGQTVHATTTTLADGTYLFADLRPGSYTVTETAPAGYIDGLETAGSTGGLVTNTSTSETIRAIPLASGSLSAGNVFGELLPASIGDRVWQDLNGNGVQDAGEPGRAGVTITLTGTDDRGHPISATTTSAADGSYTFTDLRPGAYTIEFSKPTGMSFSPAHAGGPDTSSSPNPATGRAEFVAISASVITTADAGLFRPVEIVDRVMLDTDRNGTPDAPAVGVEVTLYGPGGHVLGKATTDATGAFHFTVPAGQTYVVVITRANSTVVISAQRHYDVAIDGSITPERGGLLIQRSAPLPRTGSAPVVLLELAILLTVAGFFMSAVTRRKRQV